MRTDFSTRMGKLKLNDHRTLEVEVADSTQTRSVGLANRPTPKGDGMVFVYQYDHDAPFTVAAMKFDLDIYFYDGDGRVITMKTAKAGDLSPVFSPRPYRYVLETKAGHLSWETAYDILDFGSL